MSDNKQVVNEINTLLQGNSKISLTNQNTFYLYSTDKKLLVTIEYFWDEKSGPKYTIFVDGLPNSKKFYKSNDEYKKLYNYVNRIYNFESMLDQKIDKTPFVLSDAQEMWDYAHGSKSIEKEQEFLNDLIHSLVKRKCPIDVIQRAIYCFGMTGLKNGFPKEFNVLNATNKLVEYKTPRKNIWFYTGQNSNGIFIPMDAQSRQIFDKVKIALQKQKQTVK